MPRAKKTEETAKKTEEIKEKAAAAVETAETAVKETAAKAKKAASKTAAKAKTTTKKAADKAKTAVKEAAAKDEVVVEFGDKQVNVAEVVEAAKADYKAKGHRAPKAVTVYIKPEEGVAYYTVNGNGADDQKVTL